MELPVSYNQVFNVSKHNFNEIALKIFRYQAALNPVYQNYLHHIGVNPDQIDQVSIIPHLPIEFFKSHKVVSGYKKTADLNYFESSSTTGKNTSKHYLLDEDWYRQSFMTNFNHHFGNVTDWCILALLPNYLENKNSSLIYMVNDLISKSKNPHSGYFLQEEEQLIERIMANEKRAIKTMVFGVSFALIGISTTFDKKLQNVTIMETGGMKGRQKEITRAELHNRIGEIFPGATVHSEYGMTELFSQAYMTNGLTFSAPPWMFVSLSALDDPFTHVPNGKSGLINVIDLANINSCSFIATSDIGKMHKDGSFEVLGRYDYSEQRGCNLLIANGN